MKDSSIVEIIQTRYGYQVLQIEQLQERASRIVAKVAYPTGAVVAKINTEERLRRCCCRCNGYPVNGGG